MIAFNIRVANAKKKIYILEMDGVADARGEVFKSPVSSVLQLHFRWVYNLSCIKERWPRGRQGMVWMVLITASIKALVAMGDRKSVV